MASSTLKVYADRRSQPSRAVILFCKLNRIEFEEHLIDLFKREHRTPQYAEINPMQLVPSIVHGDFKLAESHAILIYLATAFPGVADNWYPADVQKRARLHSVLDWHHSNLRKGAMGYIQQTALLPLFKFPENPTLRAECKSTLINALSTLESFWLQESGGKFLLGNERPSIADLSLVCEIMQLQFLDEEERNRFLGPNKKVQKWIEDVKNATNPDFDEVHEKCYETAKMLNSQPMQQG